ncbi:long-chain-acyl-CoA synthetase [Acinetobacter sp. MB5]|uniref:long-chain-acyl-CoA synthetase n=1 Tax=Acinetobacter sp. MB5 TaxID=2069438 RepID=UPI000DD040F2|nr:long-chain-acyl-CoA synthetase [Acinetobacter sp. MB5]
MKPSSDTIKLSDIFQKIPQVLPKLPHIASGLSQAYLRGAKTPTGLAVAFEKTAQRFPERPALFFEKQQFSYQKLNQWANQIGHYFLAQGIQKGDVVALMLSNRPEFFASILALAKIGAISALLNTSQSGKVLSHSIRLVQPKAVIVGEEYHAIFDEIRPELHENTVLYWFADTETLKEQGTAPQGYLNLANCAHPFPEFNTTTTKRTHSKDGLFYIYTSGTTGLPKAVIFNHGRWTLAFGTYGHVLNLNQNDVLYAPLPMYHATGIVVCWCGVIAGGAALATRRKYSSSQFWSDVREFDASALGYVGEICRYLLDTPASPQDQQHRVSKMIGNGMRPNIWHTFKQRFAVHEILEMYASSEGNVGFSNLLNFDNTIGFSPTPFAIVQYDQEKNQPIRDAKGFCQPVRKGDVGLLIGKITRRSPFDGYTDAEKNRAAILQDVFKQGDAYFNSGDLVRNLGFRHAQFVDRLGDTFRWKGENVSTAEVEGILCDHPLINEAVVYGVEIPQTNGRAGMASISLATGMTLDQLDLGALWQDLKQALPAYAIPIFLRIQDQLETTSTFKYPKQKLKSQGFDLAQCEDTILVYLPQTQTYAVLSDEIFALIQQYHYRF